MTHRRHALLDGVEIVVEEFDLSIIHLRIVISRCSQLVHTDFRRSFGITLQ